MWDMGRDAKDINCSPHLDGCMDASSTLPPIPLGFLTLTTSENGDFVVIQKEHKCVDGQDTSCAVHSAPSIGEGETSLLLLPCCHPSADTTSIKHESGRIHTPNTVPKLFQVSDGPSRLLSQLPTQGAMCLDLELVTFKVDTRSWQSGRDARSLNAATEKLFSLCLKDIEEHQSTRQNELAGSSTAITLNPHFPKSSSKYK